MISINPTSYTMTPLPINVSVGNFSSIGSNVKFITGGRHLAEVNHNCVYTTNFDQTNELDPIIIGHDVWIGDEVRLMNGVKIGNGAIIGADTVIAKDVPEYAVVIGNPQQINRIRFTAKQIAKLEGIAWWNWSREEVLTRIEDMKDINKFIKIYGKSSS